MTIKYDNVYVDNTSTVVGPYEAKGPLGEYFDRSYKDLYCCEKTWEKAEKRCVEDSISILLKKANLDANNVDMIIAGDLLNQINPSCYGSLSFNIPFLGVFSACSTSTEGIAIASSFIDSNKASNIIVTTSSHNMGAEKQFRNPTEYGAIKSKTSTFTATGSASILLTNKKTAIKIASATIGKIIDYKQKDPLNMGAAMAPAAADTIYNHLKDMNRTVDYYDLILTGDLGIYGKELLEELMISNYNIDIKDIHNDCGILLYDLEKQKDIKAGGSGPVCNCLVVYTDILNKLKRKEIKRVLLVATGALFSPTNLFQHESILGIAHAIELEVVE